MYVSRQKPRLEAEKVLPRHGLDVLVPRLGINVMRYHYSKLLSIHFVYICFKILKKKLNLCRPIKQRFRWKLNVIGVCVASWI